MSKTFDESLIDTARISMSMLDIDDISDTFDSAGDGVFGEDAPLETPDAAGFDGLRIFTVLTSKSVKRVHP